MTAGTGTTGFDPAPSPPEPKPTGVTVNLTDLWPRPERDPLLVMLEAGILTRNEFRMYYEERAVRCPSPPSIVSLP